MNKIKFLIDSSMISAVLLQFSASAFADSLQNSPFKVCRQYAAHTQASPVCRAENQVIDNVQQITWLNLILDKAATDPKDVNDLDREIKALDKDPSPGRGISKDNEKRLAAFTAVFAAEVKKHAASQGWEAEFAIACLQGTAKNQGFQFLTEPVFEKIKSSCKNALSKSVKSVEDNYPDMRMDMFVMKAALPTSARDCLNEAENPLAPPRLNLMITGNQDRNDMAYLFADCATSEIEKQNANTYSPFPHLGSSQNAYNDANDSVPNSSVCRVAQNALCRARDKIRSIVDDEFSRSGARDIPSTAKAIFTKAQSDYFSTLGNAPIMAYLTSAKDPTKDAAAKANWIDSLKKIRDNAANVYTKRLQASQIAGYTGIMESLLEREPQFCSAAQSLIDYKTFNDRLAQTAEAAAGGAALGTCLIAGAATFGLADTLCFAAGALATGADIAGSWSKYSNQKTDTFSSAFSSGFQADMKTQLSQLDAAQNGLTWTLILAPTALIGGGKVLHEVGSAAADAREGRIIAARGLRKAASEVDTASDASGRAIATIDASKATEIENDFPHEIGAVHGESAADIESLEAEIADAESKGLSAHDIHEKLVQECGIPE